MSVNKVILIGNVGKDPEIRHLDENSSVATFSIATSEKYKNKNGENVENTDWHNVKFFGPVAKVIEQYVKKGTQLYVEGKIQTRSYDDKDGNKKYITEIVGREFKFVGNKAQNSANGDTSQQSNTSVQQNDDKPPF